MILLAAMIGGANRRLFVKSIAGALGLGASAGAHPRTTERTDQCCEIRSAAARRYKSFPEQAHPVNGDEQHFPNGSASFSKGLPHNSRGEPLPNSYQRLVRAVEGGSFYEIESLLLGGRTKLVNPLAQNAFELEGPDSHQIGIPAPPLFSSAEQAGELVELYWQALTRDMPFSRWPQEAVISDAISDLNAREDFRGPRVGGKITAHTLFRIDAPGVLDGPYISQFLLKPLVYSDLPMEQRYRLATVGGNFGFLYKDWLALQNGVMPMEEASFESIPRYIATQRGLTGFVHRDYTFQAFLCAALILSRFGPAALSETNPYKASRTQTGFATFGEPQIIDCLARAANAALKAAWFQKWSVHRRLRPEEFAFRAYQTIAAKSLYPIAGDLFRSSVLPRIESSTGGLLLPLAYPEGCPIHPSYPAGHAVIAGACTTMLKAFFDETFEIPEPVVSDEDGGALMAYRGPLTVGGELNKLASNVSMARNAAGIHWRSDSVEGIRLGETVALGLLGDITATCTEPFQGFRLTSFDGKRTAVDRS